MKNRIYIIFLIAFLGNACTYEGTYKAPVEISVSDSIVNDNFRGIGFHVFYHIFEAPGWHYEQVFAKRWRELNPAFARITDIQDGWARIAKPWDREQIDRIAPYLEVMKDTDTELYLTTWGAHSIYKQDERKYVKEEVDNIEYLKKDKGFDKLNYYCMTNELTMKAWMDLSNKDGLQYFKKVHSLFYDEFKKRNLDIKLLATDAAPIANWNTIEWAAENMDDITGVYGGHHYINFDPLDNDFYPWFLDKMKGGSGIARAKGKEFIIGEFGAKLNANTIEGKHFDACRYNNKALEPYAGTMLAESMLAMMNGGIYAAGYWTFNDCPDNAFPWGINKWGLSKWTDDDNTTRSYYYSVGLITKFMRGPASVYHISSTDTLLRVAAIRNTEDNSVSLALINRKQGTVRFNLDISSLNPGKAFRKYIYDPVDVPFNYLGDLQDYSGKLIAKEGILNDSISSMSLVVYTTKYDEEPPAAVSGLGLKKEEMGDKVRFSLTWEENKEEDLCYYRIYKGESPDFDISRERQIASTVATHYTDLWENLNPKYFHKVPKYYYKVLAVDDSGNTSLVTK